MTVVGFFVAALLLVSAAGDGGLLQVFHEVGWRAEQLWAAQSLALKVVAALLLILAARAR